jgi:hypothetical protein
MKRMMSDVYLEIVHPIKTIPEGIDRNLIEIPSNTRRIIEEVEEGNERLDELKNLSTIQIVQTEEGKSKLDNLTKLSTLNLIQGNEMKTDVDELKVTIKEINQKIIEFGIFQGEQKGKELREKEKIVKKEKKERETTKIFQGYKPKRPPSGSSSSSSSSDEEKGTKEDRLRNNLKERKLSKPNLRENVLDTDYIKKCLAETDNGT